ncbi:PAS domain S-box protein [Tepidibacillus fermentans]|uniref:histidine kinase n=1 Tax=Tepidibacillus fermentans TaxID=1281767 RepID=A0A4V2US04_9BACI|nr:PAS domain S-box protein [Tepidibacillus fermentans]TCS79572.1 PAS domain S-box-containing protein [Tepidibacillus fermentans]
MKERLNDIYVYVVMFLLVPMILLIFFFYYDKNDTYLSHVKQTEAEMADILLSEQVYMMNQLEKSPLIINEKPEDIMNFSKAYAHGIQKILLGISKEGLNHGALGIYSSSKEKVVLHLGLKEILSIFSNPLIQLNLEYRGTDPFYTELNGKLVYFVPITENGSVKGFIYTYHVDEQKQTDPYLFALIFLIAFVIAILGAKWVDLKTKRQINQLKQELQALQKTGEPLSMRDDRFGEIAKSVNHINEDLTSSYKVIKSIIDNIPFGIVYYDKNGLVQSVNEAAIQMTGFTKEEIENFTVSGNLLGDTQHIFWETLRSGESFLGFESFCPTKDGREIPVVTSTKPIYDEAGELLGIVSSFIDISEQSRLQKVEQRSKIILDSISDGVITVDNQGIIISFNRGAEEMTDLKAEQVIGKSYDDLFIKKKTIFTKLTLTLRSGYEYTNHKKKIKTEDGRTVHLIISTKLMRNENGEQIGAVGIYKDITKVIELEEQIQRADKLALIGELAAGTAHEIRNPLTTIQGFIQLLKYELKGNNQQYLEIVLKEIAHINEIIKEMLLLAKPSAPQMKTASLNQIIKDTIGFMNAEGLLYNVKLGMKLADQLPSVDLDERQIKQVFINLIRNSIQAMDDGGEVIIKTSYDEIKRVIYVYVIDNGVGISEENLAKIYEPFYTTKETGTGLGIPISCRIMENHGGTLDIQSKLGEGTKVTLSFPLDRDDSF